MESKKYRRLVLGLAILFSLFLFQASEDHHHGSSSCDECMLEEDMGVLTISNTGNRSIIVLLMGTISETGKEVKYRTVIGPYLSRALLLEPGYYSATYAIIANAGLNFCVYPYLSDEKDILKMIIVKKGSRTKISFYSNLRDDLVDSYIKRIRDYYGGPIPSGEGPNERGALPCSDFVLY